MIFESPTGLCLVFVCAKVRVASEAARPSLMKVFMVIIDSEKMKRSVLVKLD